MTFAHYTGPSRSGLVFPPVSAGAPAAGNLDLSFGGACGKGMEDTRTTAVLFQSKPLETNGWWIGLAFDNGRRPAIHTDCNLIGDACVPASSSFNGTRFVRHADPGWLNENEAKRHRLTQCVGSAARLAECSWLIAETWS